MNWDRVEGNWKQLSGQARTQWSKLTDDQLSATGGSMDALIGKIQEVYGIARDVATKQVRDWSETLQEMNLPAELDQAKARIERELDSASRTASQWATEASDTAREQADQLSHRIAERPLAAIGIAFAVGLVLGRLVRR